MKRSLYLSLLFLGLAAFGSAQSNEAMDALLESKAVTAGQASYLVLVAADQLAEDADQASAFAKLGELGWAPKGLAADGQISYAAYAYMLARAFDVRGGVMYSLFHSPRYAYRELVSRRMIQGRADPQGAVDGLAAVRILGRVMDAQGRAE